MKENNWKNMKMGEIEQTEANAEVLKKLITPKRQEFDLQKIIDESQIKIKRPKFENMKGGKN